MTDAELIVMKLLILNEFVEMYAFVFDCRIAYVRLRVLEFGEILLFAGVLSKLLSCFLIP